MDIQHSTTGDMERASRAIKENRWADAISELRTLHERAPNDIETWGKLGFAFSRNEQYREAIQVFDELCMTQPTEPKWHYMVGYQYYQQKLWAKAISRFDKALAVKPGYVKVLYRKGYAHTALGQEKEAIEALSGCIAHWEKMTATAQEYDRPSYGKARFQLGKIYLKKGLTFKARRHLQIAAEIDSQDHDVLYELGQCYLKLDQFNEALNTLQAADQVKPGVDYILDRLAQAHAKKGDYSSAERAYQRIPEHRRRPFVVQHMGMMYLEQGQHQKALSYLEVAAKKQPDNHNIHYALGSAQEATGQFRAAHGSYSRAVSCRKDKYGLDFKEAQEAVQRMTEKLAGLPLPEIKDASSDNEGIIESYNESRGFGFIANQSQQRIFFHVSAYAGKRKPCQGSRVKFSSETSQKGLRAVRVTLIEETGGSIKTA